MTKVYVGNLPFSAVEDEINTLFAEYGDVINVNIIKDRETGQPKGFGFVEMKSETEADTAVQALNDSTLDGRSLKVNIARTRH